MLQKELIEDRFIGIDTLNDYAAVWVLVYRENTETVHYLEYIIEYEGFPDCNRWYLGRITPEQADTVSVYNARSVMESLKEYAAGGNYYGEAFITKGPLMFYEF